MKNIKPLDAIWVLLIKHLIDVPLCKAWEHTALTMLCCILACVYCLAWNCVRFYLFRIFSPLFTKLCLCVRERVRLCFLSLLFTWTRCETTNLFSVFSLTAQFAFWLSKQEACCNWNLLICVFVFFKMAPVPGLKPSLRSAVWCNSSSAALNPFAIELL